MQYNTGREIEWCEFYGELCCCEFDLSFEGYLDTRCPDLGDWSDTPHDDLETILNGRLVSNDEYVKAAKEIREYGIRLDRERLIAYNNT